jgi:tetratricopeptide (TPR) repeat protein
MVRAEGTAEVDKASREAVESLEAYAVYKMARYDEAFRRFMGLAEKGNVQGMLNVANMLASGQGVEQNVAAAFDWYARAASQGDALGMYYTGQAYERGLGTDMDLGTAQVWYQKAAIANSTEAQLALGKLLRQQGQTEQGIRWIQAAADAGDVRAQRYLMAMVPSTGAAVAAHEQSIILQSLQAIDRAMRQRNAPGVVYYIARDAPIRLRLPNSASWRQTDRKGLQALWQSSFDQSEHYQVERSTPELTASGGLIQIVSKIVERLAGPNGERVLEMVETAEVEIAGDRMVVRALTLEIET